MKELETWEPITQQAVLKLSEDDQRLFWASYQRKKRSVGAMVALAILFPIQLFFLGQLALGIIFWLTMGGFGVWWFIEWFLTPGRTRAYNDQVAMGIIQQIAVSRSL